MDAIVDLGADVLGAIDRRNREVAALGARTVTKIAHLVFGARVGRQFALVEAETAIVGGRRETDVVENEEFGFRTDEHLIANPGLLQISFGLACNAARVAPVALARRGLKNVAKDRQRGLGKERIEMCRLRGRA